MTPKQDLVSIEDITIDVQSGFASGERATDSVVQLRMNNVTTDGNLDWSSYLRVPTSPKQVEKYKLRPGDILFNNTNSPELVGKTTIFNGFNEPVVFSNHFVRLRADETWVYPQYLARWFTMQWQQRVFERLSTQWVNQAAVRKEDLLALKIPLPPLSEQQRIASLLTRADRLRRLRRHARELSGSLLQSMFLEMFGDPIRNPLNWERRPIESMISDLRGGAPLEPEDFVESGFPVLHKGAIKQSGEIELDEKKKTFTHADFVNKHQQSVVDKTYTAVTLRDLVPTGPSIGLISRLENSPYEKYILAQGAYAFHVKNNILSDRYLVWLSNINSFRKYLRSIAVGSTQIHIRNPIFTETEIPVPPLALQEQFAGVVARHESLRRRQAESARQAEGLFQSMLSETFLG